MKWMQEQRKYENLTYLALWGMLFAVPVLSLYIRTVNDPYYTFNWDELLMIWRQFGMFFLVFLIHNFFLAPLLVYPLLGLPMLSQADGRKQAPTGTHRDDASTFS